MAVNLDTRLPLAAIGDRLNPAGMMQQAAQFRQQQQQNALAQRLAEMKADYEARKMKREQQTEQFMGDELGRMTAGQPAIERTEYVGQQPRQVVEQAAIPPREATLEDMQQAGIRAMMRAGDLQGAFEAMKALRAGQAQQIKPFGGMTKTGPDGMEYAFNQATGKYEPTGFVAQPEQQKPRIQAIRTANGIQFVDLNKMAPGAVLPAPAAQPRPSRTQMVQDESGTYLIDLDNPSAPAVPVTKPGGAPIAKPKAGQDPTVDESKNAGFYLRMKGVDTFLQKFEESGSPTAFTSMMSSLPFIGGYAQRKAMTEDQQQYRNAAMAWIRAKLRKESGAVIGDDEARSEWETYFPVPGDTAANIKQKAQLRRLAEDEMRLSAGRAAGRAEPAVSGQRQEVNILPPASQYKGKIATDQQTGQRYQSDGKTWRRIAK